ncbi:MAG: hypothetical protein J5594_06080 [Elusimicrobiaceae bacterium]|nr:hypothetical protein [Elusimicrobiaceae bacterium]
MKKLLTVMILVLSTTFINAAAITVSTSQHQAQIDSRHPLCKENAELPYICRKTLEGLASPRVYSYFCSFCPICDENGQLVRCKPNELPANGQCCVDMEIDMELLNQLPSRCKIDEGQTHPCGQCPVYYKKDHSCVSNSGELGELFPACTLNEALGVDGRCPAVPGRANQGKPKVGLTPVKPNNAVSEKGINSSKSPISKKSSKGIAGAGSR